MSESTADFTTSAPANVGDIFTMPISDSTTVEGRQAESNILPSPYTDDRVAGEETNDDRQFSIEEQVNIDSPLDSERPAPDNATTSEMLEAQASEGDNNVDSDANFQRKVEATGDAESKDVDRVVVTEDSESNMELTKDTAEVAIEAPLERDATNLEANTPAELEVAQQKSGQQKLFPEDDGLFPSDDIDKRDTLPKLTTQASSTSVNSLNPGPAIPPTTSPSTAASSSYNQSDIPVDKLTSSSDLPQARLSPMRSFSRIPSLPESSRPASVASSYPSTDDSFASADSQEAEQPYEPAPNYQDLPPELISMADRFTESIHQITSTANLSPEKLSELFQDFYVTIQDKASALLRRNTLRRTYEVQMMSFEEIAKKKKERKQKEAQKLLYEDLVEKMVCQACYNEIFMFQGGDDEAKDSTLATKIAALKLINISIEHLGVPELKDKLCKMVDKRCPKEKLALLISAHKQIVDVLSRLAQTNGQDGQSGADFVLPTLIFSVIQADPPHIASNLAFIQRFRTSKTINGEAAYCLTNFEAVVAFLETVDLTTLKVDPGDIQALAARPISSPAIANALPASAASSINFVSSASTAISNDTTAGPPSPVLPPREGKRAANPPARSSSLQAVSTGIPQQVNNGMSMPQQRMDSSSKRLSFYPADIAASAVNTADSGIKSLGSTFENSYKFLFGRASSPSTSMAQKPVHMKADANAAALEKRTQEVLQSSSALISSYTDGSKREPTGVSPPPYLGPPSEGKTPTSDLPSTGLSSNSRPRGAKTLFVDDSPAAQPPGSGLPSTIKRVGSNDSTKTTKLSAGDDDGGRRSIFSNMRNFGRGAPSKEVAIDPEVLKSLPRIPKPSQKFDEIDNASQLRLGDIDELLTDYKRMVEYLKSISAFEDFS
ncbi:hypothetical protein LIPSTDRAFT_2321 [Lipomyces starkeyi NRRL Y-11557]|uniref:VPS9 domain-containing protein n=1 Tax=Lipomyces starkeyi NRRL Y-11557 TaxID=675824 RepID=A0A1E3QB24_LIPST|nr:hypothetical protein LIPSTDRAFT_2321 [Lipomyces starkeyi NRRL Y-11557]